MPHEEPIALFDLDGSLANYDKAMLASLEALACPSEPFIDDLHTAEKLPHLGARMRVIKAEPGWWRSIERLEGGFLALEIARSVGFDIQILTKGPGSHPAGWKEKVEWCRDQPELADCPIHIVSDKGLVFGHVLFDDYPRYMSRWLANRPRGLGIMPVCQASDGFEHPNVVRWDGSNPAGLEAALIRAFERNPGEPLALPL